MATFPSSAGSAGADKPPAPPPGAATHSPLPLSNVTTSPSLGAPIVAASSATPCKLTASPPTAATTAQALESTSIVKGSSVEQTYVSPACDVPSVTRTSRPSKNCAL